MHIAIFAFYIILVVYCAYYILFKLSSDISYNLYKDSAKGMSHESGTFDDFKEMYRKTGPYEILTNNALWRYLGPAHSNTLSPYKIEFGGYFMLLNRKDYKKYLSFLKEEITKLQKQNSTNGKAPWKNGLKVVK